jgi:hypothetical protein
VSHTVDILPALKREAFSSTLRKSLTGSSAPGFESALLPLVSCRSVLSLWFYVVSKKIINMTVK